jgi:predicted DsbA family dithiol-disulfide isomerase
MNAESAPVSVDLVLDLVCPWCWLGHRNFEAAKLLAPGIAVETILRPFQLDPDVPSGGAPYRDYMAKKFAGDGLERWKMMRAYLEDAAPSAGIRFDFDAIRIRPNTRNAHRVLRWARGQNRAEAAAELIFQRFFEKGEDIGEPGVLAAAAGEAGLDADLVAELLAGERDVEAVEHEEQFFRSLGVSAVPAFIFNGQFAVSGAEEPEKLARAIEHASTLPAPDAEAE